MQQINLPPFDFNIKEQAGLKYIFDRLRKKFVRLTPEEFVRQHFIHFLIEHKHYPEALMANEVAISLGKLTKKCDTILYDRFLNPIMIIEYKSPRIAISQKTFDQISRYNMRLHVPWLIVSNGISHCCCKIDFAKWNYRFLQDIPDYSELKS
ncbi:MAG: type I restriction enzyme HsdR N-terminal domain-containing protein [Dysgonamonadaceae bacterium]|jgi:hypothetical protein|nr:type I restriction enzyme HsdR N-terminal domain-containing protein [Dysgonamonadaceae bacterium]